MQKTKYKANYLPNKQQTQMNLGKNALTEKNNGK
jgi:hypothetical protein